MGQGHGRPGAPSPCSPKESYQPKAQGFGVPNIEVESVPLAAAGVGDDSHLRSFGGKPVRESKEGQNLKGVRWVPLEL